MVHRRTRLAGQTGSYACLVGRIRDGKEDPAGAGRSPHYEIWVNDGQADYRIAVNVRSVDGSDVVAFFDPDYTNPTKLNLPQIATTPGLQTLRTGPDGQGLDYLRDDLFPLAAMAPVPADGAGMSLANLLGAQIERAKADAGSVVIVLGAFFRDQGRDHSFDFSPEQGVHDIHMMQGNSGSFASDNRVNGDGALFIRFRGGETVALFVRFTTQSLQTDPQTGAPLDH